MWNENACAWKLIVSPGWTVTSRLKKSVYWNSRLNGGKGCWFAGSTASTLITSVVPPVATARGVDGRPISSTARIAPAMTRMARTWNLLSGGQRSSWASDPGDQRHHLQRGRLLPDLLPHLARRAAQATVLEQLAQVGTYGRDVHPVRVRGDPEPAPAHRGGVRMLVARVRQDELRHAGHDRGERRTGPAVVDDRGAGRQQRTQRH